MAAVSGRGRGAFGWKLPGEALNTEPSPTEAAGVGLEFVPAAGRRLQLVEWA